MGGVRQFANSENGLLVLTKDNYFSLQAEQEYMSCSQYIGFTGMAGQPGCEAKAMAKIRGDWIEEQSKALLVGSYVHSWNEGPQAKREFIANHPEMFKKDGGLLKDYVEADNMIATLEKDEMCMYMLQGEKEVIFTAEMFGLPWKVRFDNYLPEKRRTSDLKTTKSISEHDWMVVDGKNVKASFVEIYNYPMRAAVYSEVERIVSGREEMDWFDFYIVAVSKEDPPDKAVISLKDPARYLEELARIEGSLTRIKLLKQGILQPIRCECCDYCRSTKVVEKVIYYKDL
jgi:hypothetical protein